MGDTGGMDGPDARLAFLEAVMDPDEKQRGYTADQMNDPDKYMPLVTRGLSHVPEGLEGELRHWHRMTHSSF